MLVILFLYVCSDYDFSIKKMDYKEFNITLNMKSLMLFEQLSGKSFYNLTNEDLITLIYCSLVSNNNIKVTLGQFNLIMNNKKIARELMRKCQEELDFIAQFNKGKETGETTTDETVRISEVVNTLILNYNIDINYVMNELRLWELPALTKGIDEKTKGDMAEKRFWTYMQILPHIDGRKVKGPEKLLPFPWEKDTMVNKELKFMEDNKDAIKAFFDKANKELEGNGTV